jgi:transposase
MARAYSIDLRTRVIEAYEEKIKTEEQGVHKIIEEVCKQFSIAVITCYRWIKAKKTFNTLEPIKQRHAGHSHKLKPEEYDEFRLLVEANIGMNSKQLAEKWGRGMSAKTMRKWLKRLGFTRKKKQFLYVERNEAKRNAFKEALSKIKPEDRVYMDEYGMDDNEVNLYAYSKKGTRAHAEKRAEKCRRVSTIGSLHQNNIIAPFMFEGSCDRAIFEIYLQDVLVSNLRPGMTLIMDNARFHKGGNIERIIHNAHCNILYLPPYSPDLNPIEHFWSPLKYKIKNLLQFVTHDIYEAAHIVFQQLST